MKNNLTMRQIRYKAIAKKTKEWAEGYYATVHAPRYGEGNELVGFDECPAIFNDEPGHRNGCHWTDIHPQTLCQMTNMTDANGTPIWENDIVRVSPNSEHYESYEGDVVWMETCFAVEDEKGHAVPISQLRANHEIEVVGNRYDRASPR